MRVKKPNRVSTFFFKSQSRDGFVSSVQTFEIGSTGQVPMLIRSALKKQIYVCNGCGNVTCLVTSSTRCETSINPVFTPLPWCQLGLVGLFRQRRPPASPPSQFLAPYAVHFSKQRRHAMSEDI